MPDRLTQLANVGINRVALVPKGDNPEAHLTLWKSATPSHADVSKRPIELPEGRMDKDDVTKEPRLTAPRRTALETARDAINSVLGRKEEEAVTETEKSYTLPDNADDELRAYVEKLTAERDAAVAKAAETPEKPEEPETAEDLAKAMEKADPAIREALEKAQADVKAAGDKAAEAMAKADKLQNDALHAEAMQKAASLTHLGKADEVASTIEKLRKADPELAAEVEQRLDRAEALASEAFIEIGKDGGEDSTDAQAKLDALVKARADADGTSGAVALTKVMDTPEGKELHKEINKEASAR